MPDNDVLHSHYALGQEQGRLSRPLGRVESTGVLPPLCPGSFAGYCHRPDEFRAEVEAADFECVDLVVVEGIAFALHDLEERMADPVDREVVLDAAHALERVPELLGLGPHLIATARRREHEQK